MLKKIASKEVYEQLSKELKDTKTILEETADLIKKLKESKATQEEINPQVQKLKNLKSKVEELTEKWQKSDPTKLHIDRQEFEELMTRRFFYVPAFEIYGGVGGLYDYGPSCCAIKANLLTLWRNHFIIEENMLELDCTNLTPEKVFETSGHVAKFADFMVKDIKTLECFRADKLIAEVIETKLKDVNLKNEDIAKLQKILKEVDGYNADKLDQTILDLHIQSPLGNDLSKAYPFNLMFSTQIGPTGKFTGYLRPETAQGIFVNFKRLLNYNGGNMPFAGATIGQAFRNEIAPRAGLLRVREFTLAEIEHFCNPENKKHPKYKNVKGVKLTLFPRKRQEEKSGTIEMTISEALDAGVLNNETHAYFMGRTYLFMRSAGLLPQGIRFRQHLSDEMAHYAKDCWDCELLTSYGWIECVGIADRSCYDLENHAKATKSDLTAFESYSEPKLIEVIEFVEKKGAIGKEFKSNSKTIQDYLKSLKKEDAIDFQNELNTKEFKEISIQGNLFKIKKDMCEFQKVTKKESGFSYTPAVIEPSFGIGRIIYAILEHSYWIRDTKQEKDEKEKGKKELERAVLSLSPLIAPYKVVVLPLSVDERFDEYIAKISKGLANYGISHRKDDSSAALGRRYARSDEIGIPYAITVDFDSLKDDTVTLRDRDSCVQIRANSSEIVQIVKDLIDDRLTWDNVVKKYPSQTQTASEKIGKKE